MVRIRRTKDVAQHVRYGSVYNKNVEFPEGDDVTDAAVDDAFWAVDEFDHLELVASYLPTDYTVLQSAASMAETDAVTGNDPKPKLIEWIDHLDARRREALLDAIDAREQEAEADADEAADAEPDDADDSVDDGGDADGGEPAEEVAE